jgi:tetratricopeptide (TPR) repeat protein
VLYNWSVYRWYLGDFRQALILAEKSRDLGDKGGYAELRMMGNLMVGNALHHLGDQLQALRHVQPIVNQHVLPIQRFLFAYRLAARTPLARILWLRGFPDQAIASARLALAEAQSTDNAMVQSDILRHLACPIALYVGDLAEAEPLVGLLLDYSAEYALNNWNAFGRCLKGTLLLAQGDFAGLAVLQTALEWLREARVTYNYAAFLGTMAEGLGAAGKLAEARVAIDEALERTDRNEERWCMAELLRIKGDLLRSDGADVAAEDCFQQALDWARRQEALSWELRAAMSLARLWHQNGKTAEAHAVLSSVYNRFTEGFETSDLKTARVLMGTLLGRSG